MYYSVYTQTNISYEEKQKKIDLLKKYAQEIGLTIEVSPTPLDAFLQQESEYRLDMVLENEYEEFEFSQETLNEIAGDIYLKWINCEHLFNYDQLDDDVRESIRDYKYNLKK